MTCDLCPHCSYTRLLPTHFERFEFVVSIIYFCTGEIGVSAACNLASTPPLLGYIGRQFRIKKEERFKLQSGCALFLGGGVCGGYSVGG